MVDRLIRFESWPDETKREVFELAKIGRRHPDSAVADSALTWAKRVRSLRSRVGFGLQVLFDMTIGVLLGDLGAAGELKDRFRERRAATRIVRIG